MTPLQLFRLADWAFRRSSLEINIPLLFDLTVALDPSQTIQVKCLEMGGLLSLLLCISMSEGPD